MKHKLLTATATALLCLAATLQAAVLTSDGVSPARKPVTPRNPAEKLFRAANPFNTRTLRSARLVPASAQARSIQLLGSEVFVSPEPGIYSLTWNTTPTFSLVAEGPEATGGGVRVGDTYYCISNFYGTTICYFSSYDANTWKQNYSHVQYNMDCYAHDMTYDPSDGKIYGCFMKSDDEGNTYDDKFAWGTLDPENETRTELGEMQISLAAVAATKDGKIYGLDYKGVLYSINKTNGALTKLADTGLKSTYATGGIIDDKTGKMLYILQPQEEYPALYSITIPSGETELLGQFDNTQQMRGLFFPRPLAEDGAPAQPTDLKLQFSGNALMGIFNATIPTETYGGDALSGDLTCTVTLDGEPKRTFTTYPGETLYEFMEVAEPGMHTFDITVSNSAGDSPSAEISQWIGLDELTPVSNVSLTLDGDMASLTWNAPTPIHGGYYDPDLLTYDITRLPDEVKVAEGALFNFYMGMLPATEQMTLWKFRVEALYDGNVISTAESNSIKTGADVVPPFSTSFDSQDEFDLFTVVNSNGDDFQWGWSNFYGAEKCAAIKYNLNLAMDDWLISPGIKLQAGKSYKIGFLAYCAGKNYPERLEVKYGTSATVDGMTGQLLEPTVISDEISSATKTTLMLTPETDGTYYIGFHGMSDAGQFFLYLDDFSIAESTGKAPGTVSDLTAEADYTDNSVKVAFTTPSTDEKGETLTELTKVIITRNGTKIHEFDNPAIGTALEYNDNDAPEGNLVYAVSCANSQGEGASLTASIYFGEDEPDRVTDLTVTETSKGKFHISWKAPTKGLNGGYVNPDNLTYRIERVTLDNGSMTTVNGGCKATEIDDEFMPQKQTVFAYTVRASNIYGYSRWTTTDSYIAGPGVAYPFAETCDGGMAANPNWISERISGESEWFLAERGTTPACSPQDKDGGMFEFDGVMEGDVARLASAAIDISSARQPQMIFWYYAVGKNRLALEVSADNGPWKEAFATDLATDKSKGWTKVVVDLAPFKATHSLRIAFRVDCRDTENSVFVDNMAIRDAAEFNLSIASYEIPEEVVAGLGMTVSAVIENTGLSAAEGAVLELYRRYDLVGSADIPALAPAERANVTLTDLTDKSMGDEEAYFIKIKFDKDNDDSDDQEYFRVKVVHNYDFPAPSQLEAVKDGNSAKLSWNRPEAYKTTSEGFEDYSPFGYSNSIGAWTTLNRTGSEKIKPVDGSSPVEYPTTGLALGFQVFNAEKAGMKGHDLDARTGSQMIVSFAAKVGANDDWLISPALSGEKQTVTFFAKAASAYFPEKFEVLCSTTTSDPLSFTVIGEEHEVRADWTEISVELPEGTRYFAIKYCSFDCYGLMIDDTSFSSAASKASLTGYRIYRDGKPVGNADADALTFTDNLPETPTVQYAVSAMYDLGESPLSNIVTLATGALNDVESSTVTVIGVGNDIVITGAEGMTARIFRPDGTLIASRRCGSRESIAVENGVYIVAAGGKIWKVMI